MEHPVFSGTAHDPGGARFAVVGISNMPTDWAQVLRGLAGGDLTLLTAPPVPVPQAVPASASVGTADRPAAGPPSLSMTPPSVLDLNAYLMYALGKAARRRLQERLTARGLRLWHLTVLALLSDLGPQMKTVLAARLDMNASDLVRIVDDLVKTGYVECDRDPEDRRRVVVRLTPEGGSALAELGADVSSADDELLAPLDAEERRLLSSLLRRVHAHLEAGARTAARP
ncbi:MarR family winged helix-turn-helix transcriptional regulator [Streptomyces sp. NPDC088752]|uniref:MarR family winged helix-turn-helix transcriptional regulator n=1 Tax=Streptomyces sp. NPDC088752 TaxID=3154963 RepID=UPI00341D11E3